MRSAVYFSIILVLVSLVGCGKTNPATTSSATPFPDRSLSIAVTSPSPTESTVSPTPVPSASTGRPIATLSPASTTAPSKPEPSPTKASGVSKIKALDFSLKDLKGNTVSLSSFKGKKTVMVVFFATWCPNCNEEIPGLKKLQEAFKGKDFEILAIDIKESEKAVSSFVKKNGIDYTVVLDSDGKVAQAYNVYGIPTNIIVAKDGGVSYYGNGLPDNAEAFINNLL